MPQGCNCPNELSKAFVRGSKQGGGTGMGSYITIGFQPATSWTSDRICWARLGEQMKCMEWDRPSFVPLMSRGVMRIRSVKYLKLLYCCQVMFSMKWIVDCALSVFTVVHV